MLAIKAQALLASFGEKAVQRFNYLGFDRIFAFDNPVDMSGWYNFVRRNKVDYTVYVSIAIRMDSEIERLRTLISLGCYASYLNLEDSMFIVSKTKYDHIFVKQEKTSVSEAPSPNSCHENASSLSIETLNINFPSEKEAVNNLDKIAKHTTIWSNLVNVSKLAKLFGVT